MYPETTSALVECSTQRPMTVIEKLKSNKSALEAQLADVNSAIAAIEAHPEILTVLNCLSKVRGIGY